MIVFSWKRGAWCKGEACTGGNGPGGPRRALAYEDNDKDVVMSRKSAKTNDKKLKSSLIPENSEQGKAEV
jgi:hypothetical protein